jgi:hypothetical protein
MTTLNLECDVDPRLNCEIDVSIFYKSCSMGAGRYVALITDNDKAYIPYPTIAEYLVKLAPYLCRCTEWYVKTSNNLLYSVIMDMTIHTDGAIKFHRPEIQKISEKVFNAKLETYYEIGILK